MGTRSLTCVAIDGEYRIAQYGQWDGYPGGQGSIVLNFLRTSDLDEFKEKLKKIRFLTEEDFDMINEKYKYTCRQHYPQLDGVHGADILQMVLGGTNELKNSIGFAGNSLFCEYCYVVDFDKNTFEIFEGLNKDAIESGRFESGDDSLESTKEYEPVRLVKTYSLDNLPTVEQFLSDMDKIEAQEDENI